MSMKLRYKGGFYSRQQTLYEILIYQDGYTGSKVTPIAFCDEPLEIEWAETDKLEPVQSSSATLQLYSDSDRQFTDLYTVETGSVRMDVLRDGALYWSGTMDPELYEEPFSYRSDYGVKLTFADFAILDRLNYAGKGFSTLEELLQSILDASGIQYGELAYYGSTALGWGRPEMLLKDISLLADNFYDEDGQAMTLREVLDETLRPLALRLIQKNGRIVIYDLNGLPDAFTPQEVRWESDDASLSYDKIYNNVQVSFSPYHRKMLLNAAVDRDSVPDTRTINIPINTSQTIQGFKIALSDTAKGGLEKTAAAKYFKITPVFSGSEEAGVAWTIKSSTEIAESVPSLIELPGYEIKGMLMKAVSQPFLAHTSLNNQFMLRVSLDVLADVRYNPFESSEMRDERGGYPNEKGNFNKRLKQWCNFSYIPIRLILRDEKGRAISHYNNRSIVSPTGGYQRFGSWQTGEGAWGDAFLAYYDIDDRKSNTGLGGWQTNKQCIGYYRSDLPILFHKRGSGEFINLPYSGGWLDLQVGIGLPTYDYEDDHDWQIKTDIYRLMRWLLYRNLKIELVDKSYQPIREEDVEIHAWLNRAAKEELKIDTVVGTLDRPSPSALGQIFQTSDKAVAGIFGRGGCKDRLEKLLIGTVYANYASKHAILSGSVGLLPDFGIYSDAHEPGLFLLLSETQKLRDDLSEIQMVQFESDHYEGIEYDNG